MEKSILFGQPKYDVEDAARTLRKAQELEHSNTKLFQAAVKYLKREQSAVDVILKRVLRKEK